MAFGWGQAGFLRRLMARSDDLGPASEFRTNDFQPHSILPVSYGDKSATHSAAHAVRPAARVQLPNWRTSADQSAPISCSARGSKPSCTAVFTMTSLLLGST